MGLADVVDEDGDVFGGDEGGYAGVVFWIVFAEVHGEGFDADVGILGGDVFGEGVEFGGGA